MEKSILEQLGDAVVSMDIPGAEQAARDALAAGTDPYKAISRGLARGMETVNRLFSEGTFFVPEVICCADTMSAGVAVLRPHIRKGPHGSRGKVVIGVVEGDTHDIGKNILVMMLEAEGYEVIDLGRNVPLHRFLEKAAETRADVIALSSLMTTTMGGMKTVVTERNNRFDGKGPVVVVGGAPVTGEYARVIGADGYGDDALDAVGAIRSCVKARESAVTSGGRLIQYLDSLDHRAIMPWMGAVGLALTGDPIYDIYRSPEKQLELARIMDREFNADFIYPMDYGKIFCEALKIPLLRPEHDFPSTAENPVKDDARLSALRVPDPERDGPMPAYLEALKRIADAFEKPLMLSVEGPFTLAMELVGATDMARAIVRNPDFIRRVLDFTTETVAAYAKAAQTAGVRLMVISEPSAILLSPQRFEDLVGPNLRRIFRDLDLWKALHICGDTTHLLDQMLLCGAQCLSLDQLVDIAAIAPGIPPEIVICGNIDPVCVLQTGTPAGVRAATEKQLRQMGAYPNFMVSFGCDCPPDTPVENLKAVTEAVHSWSAES